MTDQESGSYQRKDVRLTICDNFVAKHHPGGLCLATEYINNHTKMLWQCKVGHQWESHWNSVKDMNSWCPKCKYKQQILNQKTNIVELQKYAKTKNGKLISTEYINAHIPVIWECDKLHQWKAKWNTIKDQGSWCPYCFGNLKPDISELQEYAKIKNGKLISIEYINSSSKMLWECKELHQWEATWHNIRDKNSWCPICSSYKTERLCRELLEQKFGFEFKKKRFYYIEQLLEFDGYNEERRIAFEYHGEQHYERNRMWHKTEQDFIAQKIRDDFKEQFCIENNIKLIIIPYTESNNLEIFIQNLLEEM